MTLAEVTELLNNNGIAYNQVSCDDENDYAKPCKVTSLVIPCNNKIKDIEIQFNLADEKYTLDDLLFGFFFYELFDIPEEMLKDYLIDKIQEIIHNEVICITKYDLKRKKWIFEGNFYKMDAEDVLFKGYKRIMREIEKKKNPIQKLLKTQIQYEIYDFETYRCIIK